MTKRQLIARSSSIATRQRIYRVADGIEVDEVDHFEVRRVRVLYEDVILVTYHRFRGLWSLLIIGFFALLFTFSSLAVAAKEPVGGWIFFAITAAPLNIVFLVRFFAGTDEINVYSRRSQASLRFLIRKGRARELMNEITGAVRRRQLTLQRSMQPRISTQSSLET